MKLIFIGDIEFGRDTKNHCQFKLPTNIIDVLNKSDAVFFNLETVLLKPSFNKEQNYLHNKHIHIYNENEEDIKYLKQKINSDIFVSVINNHTFDYGLKGYYNTIEILDNNNYKFTIKKSYYIDDKFIYLNATDHWTIIKNNEKKYYENTNLWKKNCLLINNKEQEEYTYKLLSYLNSIKQHRIIIFSIHWGKNFQNNPKETTYLSNMSEKFFKKICDLGTDIVCGHGAHHINNKYYEIYNNKLIIYGLGDFFGDFMYNSHYHTDKSIILNYDTNKHNVEQILLSGDYSQYSDDNDINNMSCKKPYILDYLNKIKNPFGGGKYFAHEIEMQEFEPTLKKYNIKLDKIKKELSYNSKIISYKDYFNDVNSKQTYYSTDKNLSNIIYKKYNIPYAKSIDIVDIKDNINKFKFPVILKPKSKAGGNGIIDDIQNINELYNTVNSLSNSSYIVEEQKKGTTYRILILNNNIIYIKKNNPPFVIGNGTDTVESLIDKLNAKLKEKHKCAYVKRVSYTYIQQQGYDKKSALPYGIKLYLTNVVNFWNGAHDYEYINIDDVHPINIELFLKINKAFKFTMSGIDYITNSLSMPYYLAEGNVLEVNSAPAFRSAIEHYPDRFANALISNN